jgi:hypothetical protein
MANLRFTTIQGQYAETTISGDLSALALHLAETDETVNDFDDIYGIEINLGTPPECVIWREDMYTLLDLKDEFLKDLEFRRKQEKHQ